MKDSHKGHQKQKARDEEYEALKKSKFKQQSMAALRPNPTISTIAITMSVFGVIMLVLGVVMILFARKIKEIIIRYDDICKGKTDCPLSINIENDMDKKIFVYYEVTGLSQGHRTNFESKSEDQLKGKTVTLEEMLKSKDCYPATTNKEIGKTVSFDGTTTLDPNALAVPCGLMAKSFFTDKFEGWKIDGDDFSVNTQDIIWSEESKNFKNTKDPSKQWANMTDEHFITWMRGSPFNEIRKIWGIIEDTNFKKGQKLELTVKNNYDTSPFNGEKRLVLTTLNVFGSKNYFLGICYCVVGALTILATVIIIVDYSFRLDKNLKNF